MEPSPMKSEMPPKPLSPEAKPVAPAPNPEKPVDKPTETTASGSARGTLEQIAKGVPVAEATTPQVESAPAPDREKVSALLAEANSLLLELRDMRLLLSAVSSQTADTPLGREMRLDTLRMIGSMSNADMPPDAVIKLDALQKQITDLKLPDAKPEQSALLPILSAYNTAHPDKAIPTEVMDQITAGKRDSAQTIATILQSDPDLAQPVWKELTGVEGFSGLHLTPTNVLELAKLPASKENLAKANDMFGKIAKMPAKEQAGIIEALTPTLMLGALGLMFFTQVALGKGEGGH